MIPITKEGKLLGWYIKLSAEQFLLLDPEMNVSLANIAYLPCIDNFAADDYYASLSDHLDIVGFFDSDSTIEETTRGKIVI